MHFIKITALAILLWSFASFSSSVTFGSAAFSGHSTIPDAYQKRAKYALLVRSAEHIQASLKTASQLRDAGIQYQAFEIVICGSVVKELVHQETTSWLKQGQSLGITFSVCGMSLDKFRVDASALPVGMKVVDNGLIRIFQLQESGYATIEL